MEEGSFGTFFEVLISLFACILHTSKWESMSAPEISMGSFDLFGSFSLFCLLFPKLGVFFFLFQLNENEVAKKVDILFYFKILGKE